MNTKKATYSLLVLAFMLVSLGINAQNASKAKQILDKTASLLSRKGGTTASFTISSANIGNVSGSISVKGNKFCARTPKATTWFNGKTQWTYVRSSNEVNVSNPTVAQQAQMNPYKFITLYKTGYDLSMTSVGNSYQVRMKAKSLSKSVQEMIVSINKSDNLPTQVKMKQAGKWTTITIRNLKNVQLSDSHFVFNSKDFPKAEIIDLR